MTIKEKLHEKQIELLFKYARLVAKGFYEKDMRKIIRVPSIALRVVDGGSKTITLYPPSDYKN